MLTSRPNSSYEALIALKDATIIASLIERVTNESLIHSASLQYNRKPYTAIRDTLISILAIYGYLDATKLLFTNRPFLKELNCYTLAFANAKRYHHPEFVRFLQEEKLANFVLHDGSKSLLHENAYFNNQTALNKLKKMIENANDDNLNIILKSFYQKDAAGNLPIYDAIAGGSKEYAEFFYKYPPKGGYDLGELLVRAVDSRNSHLAYIFMDDLAERYSEDSDQEIGRLIDITLESAVKFNINTKDVIFNLLNAINNKYKQELWLILFEERALRLNLMDIYTILIREAALTDIDIVLSCIKKDISIALDMNSDVTDLVEAVIQAYLPVIEGAPDFLLHALEELLNEPNPYYERIANRIAYLATTNTRHLAKEALPLYSNNKNNKIFKDKIDKILTSPINKPIINTINHELFCLSKKFAPLEQFTPLIKQYNDRFNTHGGTTVEYNCATTLVFMSGNYKQASEWYQKYIKKSSLMKEDILSYAKDVLFNETFKLIIPLSAAFKPSFIEAYKNNLPNLIDILECDYFTIMFDSLFFLTPSDEKYDSLQCITNVFNLENTPLPSSSSNTQSIDLYEYYQFHQAIINFNQFLNQLRTNYEVSDILSVKQLNAKIIGSDKNAVILYEIAKNSFAFGRTISNKLAMPDIFTPMINYLDCIIVVKTEAIKAAEIKLKAQLDKKQDENTKAKIKTIMLQEKKQAAAARKLENEIVKKQLAEERVLAQQIIDDVKKEETEPTSNNDPAYTPSHHNNNHQLHKKSKSKNKRARQRAKKDALDKNLIPQIDENPEDAFTQANISLAAESEVTLLNGSVKSDTLEAPIEANNEMIITMPAQAIAKSIADSASTLAIIQNLTEIKATQEASADADQLCIKQQTPANTVPLSEQLPSHDEEPLPVNKDQQNTLLTAKFNVVNADRTLTTTLPPHDELANAPRVIYMPTPVYIYVPYYPIAPTITPTQSVNAPSQPPALYDNIESYAKRFGINYLSFTNNINIEQLNSNELDILNKEFGYSTFLLYPEDYLNLLYVNHNQHFLHSSFIKECIRETKMEHNLQSFIKNCEAQKQKLALILREMVRLYGKNNTYIVLKQHSLFSIFLTIGIIMKQPPLSQHVGLFNTSMPMLEEEPSSSNSIESKSHL